MHTAHAPRLGQRLLSKLRAEAAASPTGVAKPKASATCPGFGAVSDDVNCCLFAKASANPALASPKAVCESRTEARSVGSQNRVAGGRVSAGAGVAGGHGCNALTPTTRGNPDPARSQACRGGRGEPLSVTVGQASASAVVRQTH